MAETRELIIESPTHGRVVVLYDAEDEEKILAHRWRVRSSRDGRDLYIQTTIPHPDGEWYYPPSGIRQRRQTSLQLHRLIMNTPKGMQTDHISGDTLDNRKENLRVATSAENSRNRGKSRTNTSGFKGVTYVKKKKHMINERSKPWKARIRHNGKLIHLGMFATPEEAGKAYDDKAKELWNIVDPRMLNFPDLEA
jgi:hypothetical protein